MIPAAARRVSLYAAFTFTVMADPVSSVAYAIEAALDKLGNGLADSCSRWGWCGRRSLSWLSAITN